MNPDNAWPVRIADGSTVFLRRGSRVHIRHPTEGQRLAEIVGPGRTTDQVRLRQFLRKGSCWTRPMPYTTSQILGLITKVELATDA